MRRLELPTYDAQFVFNKCLLGMRNIDLKAKLTSICEEIRVAEDIYKRCAADATLYTITEAATIAGRVTVDEMRKLYERKLSRKGSHARFIYDELKTAPRNGICPLCAQRIVSTLDHYLAKSRHPSFAITPVNLIPACSDCNKAKLDMQPANACEQTLHPYYDDVDDDIWLFARIIESAPPVVLYYANPPDSWHCLKKARVKKHFSAFGLATLYSTHAAEELLNIRFGLMQISTHGGPDHLRLYLQEQSTSRRTVSRNSWQGTMYRALSESEWFCTEGYHQIRV